VDSADVINMPQIGFGTFQLFPDQNTYGQDNPLLTPLNNTIEAGITWIEMQAQIGAMYEVYPLRLGIFSYNKTFSVSGNQ
jgi:mannan endo-1,4-beta-mannosidase